MSNAFRPLGHASKTLLSYKKFTIYILSSQNARQAGGEARDLFFEL